jgi:hypothetical protein
MSQINLKTGTKTYTTEDRQYMVKGDHLQRMYNVIEAITNVLQTASGNGDEKYADPRVDMLTMLFTTFELDKDQCEKLLAERDKRIDAINESCKQNVKQANKLIFRENIKTLAKCFEELDPFLGLKRKQVVMQVTKDDLRKKAMDFGMFECTEAFAQDPTGTLKQSMDDALKEIKAMEKRIDEKEAALRQSREEVESDE